MTYSKKDIYVGLKLNIYKVDYVVIKIQDGNVMFQNVTNKSIVHTFNYRTVLERLNNRTSDNWKIVKPKKDEYDIF